MPEGHTLRRLADDLTAAFAGRTVRVSSPQGRFAADAAVLDSSTLLGADSAGYWAPVIDGPASGPPPPLLHGAGDGGEIGAYHHARRGPLALRLAQRLPEMTPLTVHPHLSVAHPED